MLRQDQPPDASRLPDRFPAILLGGPLAGRGRAALRLHAGDRRSRPRRRRWRSRPATRTAVAGLFGQHTVRRRSAPSTRTGSVRDRVLAGQVRAGRVRLGRPGGARVEPWTGVRSHQAKNNLKAMKLGDRCFFYHSNIGKEIVGVVEVVREAYPDPTDEKWACVDMKAVGPVPKPVTLVAAKADPALAEMALVRYRPACRSAPSPRRSGSMSANLGASKAEEMALRASLRRSNPTSGALDCFASLAMTSRSTGPEPTPGFGCEECPKATCFT